MGEVEQETGLKGIAVTPHLSSRWNALDESAKDKFNKPAKKAMEKWSKAYKKYKQSAQYKEFLAKKKAAKVAKKPKDKNAPKRPMSAFMLFSNAMRPKVQAELGTKDFSQVAKKVSELWQNISESDEAKYDARTKKQKRNTQKLWQNTRKASNLQI